MARLASMLVLLSVAALNARAASNGSRADLPTCCKMRGHAVHCYSTGCCTSGDGEYCRKENPAATQVCGKGDDGDGNPCMTQEQASGSGGSGMTLEEKCNALKTKTDAELKDAFDIDDAQIAERKIQCGMLSSSNCRATVTTTCCALLIILSVTYIQM
jgi:hypothetical protein